MEDPIQSLSMLVWTRNITQNSSSFVKCETPSILGMKLLPTSTVVRTFYSKFKSISNVSANKERGQTNIMLQTLQFLNTIVAEI